MLHTLLKRHFREVIEHASFPGGGERGSTTAISTLKVVGLLVLKLGDS